MREIPIQCSGMQFPSVAQVETAIAHSGLTVTLRASLKRFAGSVHWHLKKANESGTLELTLWGKERRMWFTIHDGRRGEWIEAAMRQLASVIERLVE